ncbi:hypothetical protein [Flavobacterium sp.]|uniref:hypothetical protein n=1 Tax=Flavobacterium sp. TaxID=239 RepID=UPI0039E3D164
MKKIGFLLFPFLFISCDNEEKTSSNQANEIFESITWKKWRYSKYVYQDNVLDTIIIDTINRNLETLNFNSNNTAVYFNPNFGTPIIGIWSANHEEDRIYTNLKRETDSGIEYFFPKSKVILWETHLEMESDTTFTYDEHGNVETKSFSRFDFKP